jgi:hypothetical protein
MRGKLWNRQANFQVAAERERERDVGSAREEAVQKQNGR